MGQRVGGGGGCKSQGVSGRPPELRPECPEGARRVNEDLGKDTPRGRRRRGKGWEAGVSFLCRECLCGQRGAGGAQTGSAQTPPDRKHDGWASSEGQGRELGDKTAQRLQEPQRPTQTPSLGGPRREGGSTVLCLEGRGLLSLSLPRFLSPCRSCLFPTSLSLCLSSCLSASSSGLPPRQNFNSLRPLSLPASLSCSLCVVQSLERALPTLSARSLAPCAGHRRHRPPPTAEVPGGLLDADPSAVCPWLSCPSTTLCHLQGGPLCLHYSFLLSLLVKYTQSNIYYGIGTKTRHRDQRNRDRESRNGPTNVWPTLTISKCTARWHRARFHSFATTPTIHLQNFLTFPN